MPFHSSFAVFSSSTLSHLFLSLWRRWKQTPALDLNLTSRPSRVHVSLCLCLDFNKYCLNHCCYCRFKNTKSTYCDYSNPCKARCLWLTRPWFWLHSMYPQSIHLKQLVAHKMHILHLHHTSFTWVDWDHLDFVHYSYKQQLVSIRSLAGETALFISSAHMHIKVHLLDFFFFFKEKYILFSVAKFLSLCSFVLFFFVCVCLFQNFLSCVLSLKQWELDWVQVNNIKGFSGLWLSTEACLWLLNGPVALLSEPT